jgi:acetyl-CoA C-acetyltransferase
MSAQDETTPVVVAAGQHTARDGGVDVLDLAERAAATALSQAPRLADGIQRVSFVDSLSSSGKAPAAALARRLGLRAQVHETSTVGGNTPQWLVARAAQDIAAGRLQATLIAGAEAIASRRGGVPPPADADEADEPDQQVGDPRPGTSPEEAAIGLHLPAHVYPMLESVRAHGQGHTHAVHRKALGRLLAPFTDVAAANPHAWFREARSPDEIAEPADDNRLTAEPYTLRMNAIINVDQGAALLVTSLAAARAAGVADRAVFVWSGAEATDAWFVPSRPRLDESPGIAAATGAALEAAGIGTGHLDHLELYSCFPIAVEMAADALGVATDDPRGLTVTGGLPYFGGPGNNYTTHGIATLTDLLRERGGTGLATGLGWFATKHAAGVYGAAPPPGGFQAGDTSAAQQRIDASALPIADAHEGEARIAAATVAYDRDGTPVSAPAYLDLPDGRRLPAAAHPDQLSDLAGAHLVGARVQVAGTPPTYRVVETPPIPGVTP